MKAVVDTNVVAYYLLGTEPFANETRAFWRRVSEPVAPASWLIELTNVLWLSCRHGVLTEHAALDRLALAQRLGIRSISVRSLSRGALARALRSGLAAYDAIFVELAVRRRLPLVTYDRRISDAFPDVARRPDQLT